jgi:uncharacterized protein
MLIQFTVGNYKSFKDRATLSLEATTDDWLEEDNVAHVPGQPEHRLLKAAAIYGPNAGGKSNFLTAMATFGALIRESSKESQQGDPIPVIPFKLQAGMESAPSFFEAVFLQDGTRYRYGFEATANAIVSEWLFSQEDSIRESRLFTRENDIIESTESFKEGKGLEKRTRQNALFLSVAAQFNGEIAGKIMEWFGRFRGVSGLEDEDYMDFTAKLLTEPEYGPLILELVKQADVGIQNLKRKDIAADELPKILPKGTPDFVRKNILKAGAFTVKTFHKRFDSDGHDSGLVELDLKLQGSAGTQKFVALTGPFLHTLRDGSILFVDELEARLHPHLTKALVALFNTSANRRNAQLIFATHDEGLMDANRVRRDQLWFVEKDNVGGSRLFCLDEIKGVRKQAKFAREYLMGQFGAVPRVGDFQNVLRPNRG